MHGSSSITATTNRMKKLFDKALQDGSEDSFQEAYESLRSWRPPKVRAFIQKHGRPEPTPKKLQMLLSDAMVCVAKEIDQALPDLDFTSGAEVMHEIRQRLFAGGLLLELLDSGDYGTVPSRQRVVRLLDEARDSGDLTQFNRAVDELRRFTTDAIKSECRHDHNVAEAVAWETVEDVIRNQFYSVWQELGEAFEGGEESAPRSGEEFVSVILARLLGFKAAGRDVPGTVRKYYSSIDVYRSPTSGRDPDEDTDWADVLVGPTQ